MSFSMSWMIGLEDAFAAIIQTSPRTCKWHVAFLTENTISMKLDTIRFFFNSQNMFAELMG